MLFLYVSDQNYETASPFLSFKACSKYDLVDLLLYVYG